MRTAVSDEVNADRPFEDIEPIEYESTQASPTSPLDACPRHVTLFLRHFLRVANGPLHYLAMPELRPAAISDR
jgi:hypothetical protein